MEYKDYYKILGLERTATQDEVKRAYRKLARKYHPDVNSEPDAEAKFKEAGEAYEVLKDPEKRAAYDELGANWQAGQQFKPPPDWDAGFEFSGGGYTQADRTAFSDFFETLFGQARASNGFRSQYDFDGREFHVHGQDHHAKIIIDLQDAYDGATRELSLRSPELDASGHVVVNERKLQVKIPKGISQGQHIRLAGQGAPGIGKGQKGDLYLEVQFRTDPIYHVEGRDVYFDLPITPWEAALGHSIKVPTPKGTVDLKIPLGARSGQKLRLKGRGIPGKLVGDLYAVIQIIVPPAKNNKIRNLYEQLAQETDFDPRAQLGV